MCDLTDLEICEAIAKIEGYSLVYSSNYGDYVIGTPYGKDEWRYNPINDDALCFQLMVKYHILIDWIGTKQKVLNPKCQAYWKSDSLECVSDENPNKAILLAIIEANSNE